MSVPDLQIKSDKLTLYLLNPDHPKGGPKARFLLAHGFKADDPEALANALAAQAFFFWPGEVWRSPHGLRYEVLGPMQLADGTVRPFLTVWQVANGSSVAEFVTAFPQ